MTNNTVLQAGWNGLTSNIFLVDIILVMFNPLVPRVQKIKIRKLALADLLALFIKERVDSDTHYCEL